MWQADIYSCICLHSHGLTGPNHFTTNLSVTCKVRPRSKKGSWKQNSYSEKNEDSFRSGGRFILLFHHLCQTTGWESMQRWLVLFLLFWVSYLTGEKQYKNNKRRRIYHGVKWLPCSESCWDWSHCQRLTIEKWRPLCDSLKFLWIHNVSRENTIRSSECQQIIGFGTICP